MLLVFAYGTALAADEAPKGAVTAWEQTMEKMNKELRKEVEELKKENKALRAGTTPALEKKEEQLKRDQDKLARAQTKLATREAYVKNREIGAVEKGRKLYAELKKREAAEKANARRAWRSKHGVKKSGR